MNMNTVITALIVSVVVVYASNKVGVVKGVIGS